MREANRNLLVRLATAGIGTLVLILVINWHRTELWALGIQLAVVIGLVEFYWIVLREDPVWVRVAGVGLGLLLSSVLYWCPHSNALFGALIFVTLAAAVLHLVNIANIQTAAARIGLMLFGLLYVPVLLTPLALIKRLPDGSDWLFLLLTVTWFGDTGAYFVGRFLGKHKLSPIISPGKTVEGAVGGLLFNLLAALLAKLWYMPQLGWLDALLISLPGGALAQSGDLVESLIKRSYQVKDSGWIMPGHGGLLDRIDGLLFCTPYVYLYAMYIFRGGAG